MKTNALLSLTSTELNLPEWLSQESWLGWIEMRRAIKKPLTKRAAVMGLRKLNEMRLQGHDPNKVLDQSTFMAWQGLYEVKENHNGAAKPNPKTFDAIRRESSIAAIRTTVASYNQVGSEVHGIAPQRGKHGRDGGVH